MLESQRRIGYVLHPHEPFNETLIVAADRDVRWGELRPALEAAREHGYHRLHFLVA